MKKTIAILLALVMMLSALASCKKKAKGTDSENTPSSSDSGRLAELGSRDFGGDEVFTILDANDYPEMHVNFATEETRHASNINEALYNRDLQLTAKYNLENIDYKSMTKAVTGMDEIRLLSANNAMKYDMVISTAVGPTAEGAGGGTLASLALQGMLKNLNEVEHLSLDKEWWSPLIYESMLLNDKIFFTTGDIAPSLYQAPAAMYVNTDEFNKSHQGVDLFQLVEDYEWTIDELLTLTKDLSKDTNNDNIMNASEDYFGIIIQRGGLPVQDFVIGAGLSFSRIDDNVLKMNLTSQTLGNLIDEKIAKLFPTKTFEYGGTGSPSEKQQRIINVTFKGGKAVFLAHQLEAAMFHLRDMEANYDVLPYPLRNENQKQYFSLVNNWCDCFVAVPSAVKNDRVELIGFIMEAMAAYSHDNLRPLIYEMVLKMQRVNNQQSSEMVDIIMDGIVIDYAIVYDIGGLQEMAKNAALEEMPLESQAAGKQNTINSAIEDIMKAHGLES